MKDDQYQLSDDQLEKLNNGEWIALEDPVCPVALYPPEGRIRVGELKRLCEETGAGLRTVKLLLDNYGYDEAKQMILDVLVEINKQGRLGTLIWSTSVLEAMPIWKRDLIERSFRD
jgi:hypothetical protein